MRITLRLILSLVLVATGVVCLSASLQARHEQIRLQDELQKRAVMLAESLEHSAEPLVARGDLAGLGELVDRFGDRERLAGVAVYAIDGEPMAMTQSLLPVFRSAPWVAREVMRAGEARGDFVLQDHHRWHLQAVPLRVDRGVAGALMLVHDASYIEAHGARVWREHFLPLLLHVLLISLTTLAVVRWSVVRPMARTVEWIKRIRSGEWSEPAQLPKSDVFGPLAREVTQLARSLLAARKAAEQEARLRYARQSQWTPERLKEHVRTVLQGRQMLVIANREPYAHVRQGRQIRWMMPASGLVTAGEPILRACGGTWIAHGSGDADRETADKHGRLRVPPESPAYTLRRVWLTKEQENGYYYGFSNEGLWPLCHIAHARPVFRAEDWAQYRKVNELFAQAAIEELEGTEEPCILIQDYHFALLPRLIKERRPDAKIALFWHIPWPNPEAFGICPWAPELLDGMLGADLLGFHIQFHCNNFLDTVDRLLESRIDWEQFAINRAGHTTFVKPFPISIAPDEETGALSREQARALVTKELGITPRWLGVGVDRIDYTKGIGERFRAIERLLEKYPEFRGQFTFVDLGAPSRTFIPRYADLGKELASEVERINQRFQTRGWKPIILLYKHHSHDEILPFYRAADVCVVTSLHDGMNLVAKEFVMSRRDERGALVLSRFAGASRELTDALLVNPYDTEQVADAMAYALRMDADEQAMRMTRMRQVVQDRNIYRWAAGLVGELARLRSGGEQEAPMAQAATG